ncbi:MAG: cytochrome c3 family protein [Desulfobulbaceae bacterium]|nr:cytochrome c3 family protein [Desulfobulbaceae bacterium]
MSFKISIAAALMTAVLAASSLQASNCLTGGCHEKIIAGKYIHGPVAAEQAGAKGCITCHIPAGRECSENAAGSFQPLPPADTMCRMCHTRENDTRHTEKEQDCLKCHDPHGSDTSPVFLRETPLR